MIAYFLYWIAAFWVALMVGGVWSGWWMHHDWVKEREKGGKR